MCAGRRTAPSSSSSNGPPGSSGDVTSSMSPGRRTSGWSCS
jgi:hypothetical protein